MADIQAEQLQALTQEQLKELQKLQTESENLLKRMRGEEVESDKEVEGDLDAVPLRFHSDHAPRPEQVSNLIRSLLRVVEADQRSGPGAQGGR